MLYRFLAVMAVLALNLTRFAVIFFTREWTPTAYVWMVGLAISVVLLFWLALYFWRKQSRS